MASISLRLLVGLLALALVVSALPVQALGALASRQPSAARAPAGPLAFEDRLACRQAIEQVY